MCKVFRCGIVKAICGCCKKDVLRGIGVKHATGDVKGVCGGELSPDNDECGCTGRHFEGRESNEGRLLTYGKAIKAQFTREGIIKETGYVIEGGWL